MNRSLSGASCPQFPSPLYTARPDSTSNSYALRSTLPATPLARSARHDGSGLLNVAPVAQTATAAARP
jgi:hypothetical protein